MQVPPSSRTGDDLYRSKRTRAVRIGRTLTLVCAYAVLSAWVGIERRSALLSLCRPPPLCRHHRLALDLCVRGCTGHSGCAVRR